MSITVVVLPNGVAIETSASLAEVVSVFGAPQSASPVVSAPSKTTPTEAVKPLDEHKAATKRTTKAAKPTDGKAAFAEMRRLQREGDVPAAIAIAEGRGWHAEADKLRAKVTTPKQAKQTPNRGVGSNVPKTGDPKPIDADANRRAVFAAIGQAQKDATLHLLVSAWEAKVDHLTQLATSTTGVRQANAEIECGILIDAVVEGQKRLAAVAAKSPRKPRK